MKILLTLLLLLCAINVRAQQKLTEQEFMIDSARIVKPKLVIPQFRFDNRLTLLNRQKISITGIDVGVLLKNKLRVTLGYYRVADNITSLQKNVNNIEYTGQYTLNYGALNLEFIYKNTRFFSLGMPIEFGFGSNTLNYKSEIYNLQIDKQTGFISMAYFGISGTFKPIRWIGLKVAFGYRKTIYNQINNLAFDGIYTSIGLAIDFREIITDGKMFNLRRKYHKDANFIETAVDLITD